MKVSRPGRGATTTRTTARSRGLNQQSGMAILAEGGRDVGDGKLLLVLRVELGDGKAGHVEVRQGQNLAELALDFCHTHGLDASSVAGPLTAHLESNVNDIARQADAASAPAASSPPPGGRPSPPHNGRQPGADRQTIRPRSAMDPRAAEAYRSDLELERQRRIRELEAVAAELRALDSSHAKERPFLQQGRPQTSAAYGAWQDSSSLDLGTSKGSPTKAMTRRPGGTAGPQSVRPVSAKEEGNGRNGNGISVVAGERMYSQAMRKISQDRQSVVRAAMEQVASSKRKSRAAGPQHPDFQRLYRPMQVAATRPSANSPPRPKSAPRQKSGARLVDEASSKQPEGVNGMRRAAKQAEGTGRARSAPRGRPHSQRRSLPQDPVSEPEADTQIGPGFDDPERQEVFNSKVTEQSAVFQRLYEAAERRKASLEEQRASHEILNQREMRRKSKVSINARSRALAETNRGGQDVFSRLHEEASKISARKQEVILRAKMDQERIELAERPSEFDPMKVLEPFQPDIGPAARQHQRRSKLLESLDADGRRKKQEIQLREAVKRAQTMEGCTFHPQVFAKSKKIVTRRRCDAKSVRAELLETAHSSLRTKRTSVRQQNSHDSLDDSSDSGGWQIFEDRVLSGVAAPYVEPNKPPPIPPRRRQATQDASTNAEIQSHTAQISLQQMKAERLESIFRLLDTDGNDTLLLPVHDSERAAMAIRLQDAEVLTLIVDAMSVYASHHPTSHGRGEFTLGDFKRACFRYFDDMNTPVGRKAHPWKAILSYEKAPYKLPHGASRALQEFQLASSRERSLGKCPVADGRQRQNGASSAKKLPQDDRVLEQAYEIISSYEMMPHPSSDVSVDCGKPNIGGAGASVAPLQGKTSPVSGSTARPSRSRPSPLQSTDLGDPLIMLAMGFATPAKVSEDAKRARLQDVVMPVDLQDSGPRNSTEGPLATSGDRLQSLAKDKHQKRQAWMEVCRAILRR